jgi:hypothetical protein
LPNIVGSATRKRPRGLCAGRDRLAIAVGPARTITQEAYGPIGQERLPFGDYFREHWHWSESTKPASRKFEDDFATDYGAQRSATISIPRELVYGPLAGLILWLRNWKAYGMILGLLLALAFGLVGGLVSGLVGAVLGGLSVSLGIGLAAGVLAGGEATLRHAVFPLWLIRNDSTP